MKRVSALAISDYLMEYLEYDWNGNGMVWRLLMLGGICHRAKGDIKAGKLTLIKLN